MAVVDGVIGVSQTDEVAEEVADHTEHLMVREDGAKGCLAAAQWCRPTCKKTRRMKVTTLVMASVTV